MRSLQARLLFSSAMVLTLFLLILAVYLDHSFRTQKINDIAARLNIYVQSVISQIEIKDKYTLCKPMSFIGDARFSDRINPSLFGIVHNENFQVIWKSTSAKVASNVKTEELVPYIGKSQLGKLISKIKKSPDGRTFLTVSFKISLRPTPCENHAGPHLQFQPLAQREKNAIKNSVMIKSENNIRVPINTTEAKSRVVAPNKETRLSNLKVITQRQGPPYPLVVQDETIVIKISEALDAKLERFEEEGTQVSESKPVPNGNKKDKDDSITVQSKLPVATELLAKTKVLAFIGPVPKPDPETLIVIANSVKEKPNHNEWKSVKTEDWSSSSTGNDNSFPLVVKRTYYDDLYQFRITLAMGFVGVLGVYLLLFTIFLRLWGLLPMRRVSKELERIKSGEAEKLTGLYPEEISGLTESINRLIITERAQQERYRNSLGDLAHSLKTPLSVLIAVADQKDLPSEFKQDMQDQVIRMRQIVDYQLQRAAAGRSSLSSSVLVGKSIQRLANTLFKAYAEKNVSYSQNIDSELAFRGDEGDFLEMFGNLMENAFKWCRNEVRVSARHIADNDKYQLSIEIEDNGPGVPSDMIESVLARGFRADEAVSGQGIGLSVVKEIVHAYHGALEISHSALGGAMFRVLV